MSERVKASCVCLLKGVRVAFFRRTPKPVEAPTEETRQAFWNLAGAPGLISAAAYFGGSELDQAMRNAASFACIDVIADAVGRTPMIAMRGPQPMDPQPSVLVKPSPLVGRSAFGYQQAWSIVTDGNAFSGIGSMSSLGYPTALEMIDPIGVTERHMEKGVPTVRIGRDWHKLYPFGDIWHVPGRMVTPGSPFAVSPIHYANKTIGTSLAAEQFSFDFFAGGAHPSALVYANTALTKDQAAGIKEAIRQAMTGREVSVMGADLKFEKVQTPAGETQFIDLLRFEVEQACRFWRVPPSMVYAAVSGQAVTYANASQADLAFLKHTLDGYFVRIEEAWSDILPKPQTVQADRMSILRMDPKSLYETEQIALANRTTTVNELRVKHGDLPFQDPIYDEPGLPGGQETVGQLMRGLTPAVGVYLTADEAREMVNELGGDLPMVGPDAFAPPASSAPAVPDMVQKAAQGESEARQVQVYAVMPEQRDTIVNVAPTPVNVNVSPTPITVAPAQVNVTPTPVTIENRVDVAPAQIPPADVTVIPSPDNAEITFKRDKDGRIISAKKRMD